MSKHISCLAHVVFVLLSDTTIWYFIFAWRSSYQGCCWMPWLCHSCLLACPVPFYVFLVQQNRRHAAPPSDIFKMPSGSALPVKRQVVEALHLVTRSTAREVVLPRRKHRPDQTVPLRPSAVLYCCHRQKESVPNRQDPTYSGSRRATPLAPKFSIGPLPTDGDVGFFSRRWDPSNRSHPP